MNREPTRLLEGTDVDPRLRSALGVVAREAPSEVQLAGVVEGVTRELQRVPRAPRARKRSHGVKWLKLLSLLGLGGVGYASMEPPADPPAADRAVASAPADAAGPGVEVQIPARAPIAKLARESAAAIREPAVEGRSHEGRAIEAPAALARPMPASAAREAALRASPPSAPLERGAGRGRSRDVQRSPMPQREVVRASGRAAPIPSELELLSRAQAFLATAPGEALRLLAEHELHHAQGQFAEERDALRLQLLERLARPQELEQRARAFLARYPRSPHRARVQRLLGPGAAAE